MLVSIPKQPLRVNLGPFPFGKGNSSVAAMKSTVEAPGRARWVWIDPGQRLEQWQPSFAPLSWIQVLQERIWVPLDLAELSREHSLWSSSSLAAQPVPSLPLHGVVLEDCGAPWVFLRGFV